MIRPGSKRSFQDALRLAGLAAPTSKKERGERYLDLLVSGIDHELVGTGDWYLCISYYAPDMCPDELTITPGSNRTFFEALRKAGLDEPTCPGEIAERYLQLLVEGVDHDAVGTEAWYLCILEQAPDRHAANEFEKVPEESQES